MDDFIQVYQNLAKDHSYFKGGCRLDGIDDPELFKAIERYRALADIHPLEQIIIKQTSKRAKMGWINSWVARLKKSSGD